MVDINPQEPHVVVVLQDLHIGRKIAGLFRVAGKTRVDFLSARNLPVAWMDADALVCCKVAAVKAREDGFRGRIIVMLSELPTPQASAELQAASAECYFIGSSLGWIAEVAKTI